MNKNMTLIKQKGLISTNSGGGSGSGVVGVFNSTSNLPTRANEGNLAVVNGNLYYFVNGSWVASTTAWGSISGNVSNQTDIYSFLDGFETMRKVKDSDFINNQYQIPYSLYKISVVSAVPNRTILLPDYTANLNRSSLQYNGFTVLIINKSPNDITISSGSHQINTLLYGTTSSLILEPNVESLLTWNDEGGVKTWEEN